MFALVWEMGGVAEFHLEAFIEPHLVEGRAVVEIQIGMFPLEGEDGRAWIRCSR